MTQVQGRYGPGSLARAARPEAKSFLGYFLTRLYWLLSFRNGVGG